MANLQEINYGHGTVVCDPQALLVAYGAHALRVTFEGEIELLLANTEESQWQRITDAELVQPAGTPAKARKQ